MMNTWSVSNSVIPVDWIDLVKAALEPRSQLQWISLFREKVENIEEKGKARGIDIYQDQILEEGY